MHRQHRDNNNNNQNKNNRWVQQIKCTKCRQPMELHMAHSSVGQVTITFECEPCQRQCDIVAKTKPPQIDPSMLH